MEEIGFFHLNLKKLEKKNLKCFEMTGQVIKVIDTAAPTCTVQKLIEILCKFAPSGNVIIGLADWVYAMAWHLTDKLLPEPKMARICCHIASLGLKELRLFWNM